MSDGIQKFELWENWARKRSPNRRESFSPRGKNVNRNFPGEPCSSYVSSSTFAGVVSLLGNSLIIKSRSFIQLVFKLNDKYSFLEYRNVTKLGGKPKTVISVWDLESKWGGYRKLFSCATSRHQKATKENCIWMYPIQTTCIITTRSRHGMVFLLRAITIFYVRAHLVFFHYYGYLTLIRLDREILRYFLLTDMYLWTLGKLLKKTHTHANK